MLFGRFIRRRSSSTALTVMLRLSLVLIVHGGRAAKSLVSMVRFVVRRLAIFPTSFPCHRLDRSTSASGSLRKPCCLAPLIFGGASRLFCTTWFESSSWPVEISNSFVVWYTIFFFFPNLRLAVDRHCSKRGSKPGHGLVAIGAPTWAAGVPFEPKWCHVSESPFGSR